MNDALRTEILNFYKDQEEGTEEEEMDSILNVLRSAFK